MIEVRCRYDGDATVLDLVGDVCLATAPTVRSCIDAALATCPRHLVIDLAGVTVFGATALNLLLETVHHTRATGCAVHLTGAVGLTAYVLSLTSLERHMTPSTTGRFEPHHDALTTTPSRGAA